jgi:hypothetical protein
VKRIAETLGVARSNLVERAADLTGSTPAQNGGYSQDPHLNIVSRPGKPMRSALERR